MPASLPRILSIAGSDSGGGAGMQADIKTITALGGYAMSALTAVTVQNTRAVQEIVPVPNAAVTAQIHAVLSDIGADIIKTGMLGDTALIEAVAQALHEQAPNTPCVVDPVMIASSGDILLPPHAIEAVRSLMLPRRIVTPNAPEASHLTGIPIANIDDQRRAADALLQAGAAAALVKGGHIAGDSITDILAMPEGEYVFTHPRIPTRATHGTGCTLASAIAVRLGHGATLPKATEQARAYLYAAIKAAPGFGHGHGPLHHGFAYQAPPSDP